MKLNQVATNFINHVYMSILGFFPKCIEKVVNLHESINDLGRIGKTLFRIMGITKFFFVAFHMLTRMIPCQVISYGFVRMSYPRPPS
jgi:hypothetical protein